MDAPQSEYAVSAPVVDVTGHLVSSDRHLALHHAIRLLEGERIASEGAFDRSRSDIGAVKAI